MYKKDLWQISVMNIYLNILSEIKKLHLGIYTKIIYNEQV